MKKLLLVGFFCSLSFLTYADSNNALLQDRFSVAAGYVGLNIDFKDLDGDEKLNGFFINGAIALDSNISIYSEYSQQKVKQLKFDEVSLGAQYKFYDSNDTYASAGLGLGYMWLDQTLYSQNMLPNADLKLNYITLPLHIEAGYKFTKHISTYGNLGYTWLFNRDSEVCIESIGRGDGCDTLDNNANGLTYKVGLRYSF